MIQAQSKKTLPSPSKPHFRFVNTLRAAGFLGITLIGLLAFGCAPLSHAKAAFEFAPPKTAYTASAASSAQLDPSTQMQLSTIGSWGQKFVALVPSGIRLKVESWDTAREQYGAKYASLRDASIAHPKTGNAPAQSAPLAYYWYALLALLFGHQYLFYAVALFLIILIGRTLLYRFNLVA